jgi:uncharacterized protein (DUF1684 family)
MNYGALADYRRNVAVQYAAVRSAENPAQAAKKWRQQRDHLFKTHPLSPIPPDQKQSYPGIPYAPYDPGWRFEVSIESASEENIYELDLPEGHFRYQRFGRVNFTAPTGEDGQLSLFWILGYGGGIFLPFGDTTNNRTTYGGGRYLYDTIKGADLGAGPDSIVLDFNFAYHPSCRYSPEWTCPLTPPENRLSFEVPVGELLGELPIGH